MRWTLFIVPVLGAIWIPGILSFTTFPHATVSILQLGMDVFLPVNYLPLLGMECKADLLEYLVEHCLVW